MLIKWEQQPRGEGWDDIPDDVVVWLAVPLVEASFALDRSHYVGPYGAGAGQRGRYENIGRHFLSGRPIWMPHLGLSPEGTIEFTDGRHRFAWIRDHGAVALPVTADPDGAAALVERYGTHLRECRVA
jgi:hypothetical protein